MQKRLDSVAALDQCEPYAVTREVHVPILSDDDVVLARQNGRALAAELQFPGCDLPVITATISELAHNLLEYAGIGEITLRTVACANRSGLVVVADDGGPGIENVEQALLDGYSTSGGLGLGLPGVRRLMDEFEIQSRPGVGTTVTATKWRSTT